MQTFALPSIGGGDIELRNALASFFNSQFKPIHPISPAHIILTGGASDAIESIVHAVCEDGDSVIVPGPYWCKHSVTDGGMAQYMLHKAEPYQMASTRRSRLEPTSTSLLPTRLPTKIMTIISYLLSKQRTTSPPTSHASRPY